MMRYDYKNHFGGIILVDNKTKNTIFLQPGNDSGYFLHCIDVLNYSIESFIQVYFDNLASVEEVLPN